MNRKESLAAGLCLGGAVLLSAAAPAQAGGPGGAQFFTDPVLFEQTLQDIGKIGKGFWDFKPDFMPDDSIVAIDDVLDITTHPVNAPGVWQDAAGNNLWPPEIDNVQFSGNANPGGLLQPVGPGGLFYAKPAFAGLSNNMLGSNFPTPSFTIVSGPPAGDNHTAISFDMLTLDLGAPPPVFLVTVFNKNGQVIGEFSIDGGPNQKIFLGVIASPGDTIRQIDIWDQSGGFEGISSIALYREQPPWCPWDCGTPHDKMIGVVDFLALLAQWGIVGAPCDFDGGGVGVTDFLKLLSVWGPCPTPVNDECFNKTLIDRLDPAGQQSEHFDMYGATPSPEPSPCTGLDPNILKDIWYCLRNDTNQEKRVTLSGNVDLLVEVTAGCTCPPGPLVTCGILVAGNTAFNLLPGQEVCIRLLNDLELPNDELKGNLVITNEPVQPPPVNFYTDPGLFDAAVFEAGKVSKAFWNFKPDFVPDGTPPISIDDVLDITTHPNNAPGVWQDSAGNNLWPPEVDNVQFSSNLLPQGPWKPRGVGGLVYLKPNSLPGIDNNVLAANTFADSFEIISGPPAGDNHTAIAFEVVQVPGFNFPDPVFHISVYDKNDVEIGKFILTALPGQKLFVGILSKDPTVTIGRVDVWDTSGGAEGISNIALYQQLGSPNACPDPGVCGSYVECGIGSPFNCICFQVDNDPNVGICIQDFFCGDVQPCPVGADCPPGFVCVTNSCCGEPVCAPIIKCDDVPLNAPQSLGSGLTGSGEWIEDVE